MRKQSGSLENEMALSIMVVGAFAILVFILSRKLGADFEVWPVKGPNLATSLATL